MQMVSKEGITKSFLFMLYGFVTSYKCLRIGTKPSINYPYQNYVHDYGLLCR